jgi:hypothetical protein
MEGIDLILFHQKNVLLPVVNYILEEENIESVKSHKVRKIGSGFGIHSEPKYWDSTWGRMIRTQIEELNHPNSRSYKLFRRRFRLPFHFFCYLLEQCRIHNIFEVKDPPMPQSVPNEIKLLGVLRVLGRGWCFDDVKVTKDQFVEMRIEMT